MPAIVLERPSRESPSTTVQIVDMQRIGTSCSGKYKIDKNIFNSVTKAYRGYLVPHALNPIGYNIGNPGRKVQPVCKNKSIQSSHIFKSECKLDLIPMARNFAFCWDYTELAFIIHLESGEKMAYKMVSVESRGGCRFPKLIRHFQFVLLPGYYLLIISVTEASCPLSPLLGKMKPTNVQRYRVQNGCFKGFGLCDAENVLFPGLHFHHRNLPATQAVASFKRRQDLAMVALTPEEKREKTKKIVLSSQ